MVRHIPEPQSQANNNNPKTYSRSRCSKGKKKKGGTSCYGIVEVGKHSTSRVTDPCVTSHFISNKWEVMPRPELSIKTGNRGNNIERMVLFPFWSSKYMYFQMCTFKHKLLFSIKILEKCMVKKLLVEIDGFLSLPHFTNLIRTIMILWR